MNRRDFSSMLAGTALLSLLLKSAPLMQPLNGVPHVSDPATREGHRRKLRPSLWRRMDDLMMSGDLPLIGIASGTAGWLTGWNSTVMWKDGNAFARTEGLTFSERGNDHFTKKK